jgi:hypothetical protein
MLDLHLARFDLDATPPMGHPLCGGWIKPAEAVDDPLKLRGIVLLGAGMPIVLASVDWTGVMNESHRLFCEALAEAARTTPDRVSLHTVHQHNAPFVDREANRILRSVHSNSLVHNDEFVDALMTRASTAVKKALEEQQPVTHLRVGQAKVEQVACNRRVLGPNGKIRFNRTSATKDPAARAEPDGAIDPVLRSISFLQKEKPLARLYYYATHPMSYYGDGRVSSDFVGLARAKRDAEEPAETLHVYFTGASGNVTAGKYNDGSKPMRAVLAERIHAGMVGADRQSRLSRLDGAEWLTAPVLFPSREDLDLDTLMAIVADPNQTVVNRNRNALTCGWLKRQESGHPILLSRLNLPGISILNLPGETFIEYQLYAQWLMNGKPLATAAYGDDGPWYIPLRKSYEEGGYEPTVSFVSPRTEAIYRSALEKLLRAKSNV